MQPPTHTSKLNALQGINWLGNITFEYSEKKKIIMDKCLTRSIICFLVIAISHSSLCKPKYSYVISNIKLDTINEIVYIKAEITVKNQSLFRTRFIPSPILTSHLTAMPKDTFAYTTNFNNNCGNISFYTLDSFGNKYFFHPSYNECGAIRTLEQNNSYYVKLKPGSVAIIEVIGILQINVGRNNNNCITTGGFRTKVSFKHQSDSKSIDLVINKSIVYCEYRVKNKIYNSIIGSVLY